MSYPQTLGIYSRTSEKAVGSGLTCRASTHKTYWYVRRTGLETYEIQPLNSSNIPSGHRQVISKGQLMKSYEPEPGYYESKTLPILKSLQRKIDLGEKFLHQALLSQAEKEFLKATMIHEENLEANIGLGNIYIKNKEFGKVKKVLKVLLNADLTLNNQQRHQFNIFGISLRKSGQFDDAIRYYNKALKFNEDDENLHFNIARAYYERQNQGDLDACKHHLHTALSLRPNFDEGLQFHAHLLEENPS